MSEIKGSSHFRLMALSLWLRDIFFSPTKILREAGLKTGDNVLDFGCGPGSFSLAAARIVGQSGKVYALDVHTLAIHSVKRKASKKAFGNIETISSDGATGLPEESVDFIILNDVFHELDDPEGVLAELHRIMRPDGTLSFSDHHMNEEEVLSRVTKKELFRFLSKVYKAYTFRKVRQG